MALREAHGDAEAQPVTPMEEIRRRKGMPFEEFCAKHPVLGMDRVAASAADD